MSLETRLRQTGGLGGGGGASSSSAGLAGTGNLYVVTSASPLLPQSRILTPGSSVTIVTDATSVYISAITNAAGAADSGGLAGTGGLWVVYSSSPLFPNSRIGSANFPLIAITDATFFYTQANTSFLVTSNITISTTYPVAGGGNLGANQTHTVDTAFLVTSNRTISTTSPIGGGGDLSANRTFTVGSLSTIGSANQFLRVNTGGVDWGYINFRGGSSTVLSQGSGFIQIDATTNAATTNIGTGGFLQLPVQAAKLYASTSAARIDAGSPFWRLLFSPTTQQYGVWQFTLPFDYSGSPATQLIFSSDSALSVAKSVQWIVDQWGFSNSQGLIYTDTFAGANVTTIALSAGYSAGNVQILTVPLATLNSFNAGNIIRLRVSSSAGSVTGNQELLALSLFYRAGTQTIATGSIGLLGTGSVVQTYSDITSGRSFNTTYSNSGSTVIKSIMSMLVGRAVITLAAGSSFFQAFADTGGVPSTAASGIVGIENGLINEDNTYQLCFVASPGVNYRVNATTLNGTLALGKWFEFNF